MITFRNIALLVTVVALVGCATTSRIARMTRFNSASKQYRTAIRWSDFETAHSFKKTNGDASQPLDQARYGHIKVTSYEVKSTVPLDDGTQVKQLVEITFYDTRTMKLRNVRHSPSWQYDEEGKLWHLVSDLPAFE